MKSSLILWCFFIHYQLILAQNLIPNPGFDDLTACPDQPSQIDLAFPWTTATRSGTPDLYNTCATDQSLRVPYAGPLPGNYQIQRSGTGFAGIGIYFDNAAFKEYLEVPLHSTLIKGNQYYVEFYVSLYSKPGDSWVYTDDLGLAFVEALIDENAQYGEALSMWPAVENQQGLIRDTASWIRLSGCYTATGNESYVIIGNFKSDDETHIVAEDATIWPLRVYVFIEDVLVQHFDPLPDTLVLCDHGIIDLDAGFLDAKYAWSNGAIDAMTRVNTPGTFMVEAVMEQCILRDTIVIVNGDGIESALTDTVICATDQLEISAPLYGSYSWSTGGTTEHILVQAPEEILLTVTNDCGAFEFAAEISVSDCDCHVYVPNILSLNGDGINDAFTIAFSCDLPLRIGDFTLFDRWGNALFSASGEDRIDFDLEASALPSGVYAWVLEYEVMGESVYETKQAAGDITICR